MPKKRTTMFPPDVMFYVLVDVLDMTGGVADTPKELEDFKQECLGSYSVPKSAVDKMVRVAVESGQDKSFIQELGDKFTEALETAHPETIEENMMGFFLDNPNETSFPRFIHIEPMSRRSMN